MEQQGLDPAAEYGSWDCSTDGIDREALEACGSTLRVKGTGKVSALVFPI